MSVTNHVAPLLFAASARRVRPALCSVPCCRATAIMESAVAEDEKKPFDAELAVEDDTQPDPDETLTMPVGNGFGVWIVKARPPRALPRRAPRLTPAARVRRSRNT